MKKSIGASSIVSLACFFLLAGCESISVPNYFGDDEVPDEVKEQPTIVDTTPPPPRAGEWPRLGDVPFKPKDFSTKPAYDETMDEMERLRLEADTARSLAVQDDPRVDDRAASQNGGEDAPLYPPQFPAKPYVFP